MAESINLIDEGNMIGKIIHKYRTSKQLTQAQLAELIGVGQSTVAMYERGSCTPSWSRVHSMSKVFGVSLEVLASELARASIEQEQISNN